jgi:hypothetical protein
MSGQIILPIIAHKGTQPVACFKLRSGPNFALQPEGPEGVI